MLIPTYQLLQVWFDFNSDKIVTCAEMKFNFFLFYFFYETPLLPRLLLGQNFGH